MEIDPHATAAPAATVAQPVAARNEYRQPREAVLAAVLGVRVDRREPEHHERELGVGELGAPVREDVIGHGGERVESERREKARRGEGGTLKRTERQQRGSLDTERARERTRDKGRERERATKQRERGREKRR